MNLQDSFELKLKRRFPYPVEEADAFDTGYSCKILPTVMWAHHGLCGERERAPIPGLPRPGVEITT